ncbi:MAG: DNA polymerase III subunit delta' C-terminal domain-containing protein [Gammaproteobacteria bacterium]
MINNRHVRQAQKLIQADERGRLGHAYLLSGSKGIGKREFAYHFIQSRLCVAPQAHQACGTCKPCQHFLQAVHPDLLKIIPENGTISIDMIRSLEDFVTHTAQGKRKWVVIEDAHQLNIAASQALLKTLEEPINTTFFLITHQLLTLLPTIRSRCQTLVFQGEVEEVDTGSRHQLLLLGLGQIDPLWLAEQWQKESPEERLYLIYGLMHDLLKLSLSVSIDHTVNEAERPLLQQLSERLSMERFWAAYDTWRFIQSRLQQGVRFNPGLMFESMLIHWQQIWGSQWMQQPMNLR